MRYFCKLEDVNETVWQGPYETLTPQAAASLWIKREWDCRHRELVPVVVKDITGALHRVKMRVRVTVILERNGTRLWPAA